MPVLCFKGHAWNKTGKYCFWSHRNLPIFAFFYLINQFRSHGPTDFNSFQYYTAKVNPFFHNV